jgi:dTDP-4-dehydrorhamnose reductase
VSWLILGGNGQLGRDLQAVLADRVVAALDLPAVDITDPDSVRQAVVDSEADVVVNAAAYTAVDAAETDEATATLVNGAAPGIIAGVLRDFPGTRLVQVSTDYVFPGDSTSPYREDEPTGPRSAYGRSKLAGERAVLEVLPERSYVIRTAWLYSQHGSNFVKTMLRLEREHDTVSVVDDQAGQPTWSHDLAEQIRRMVDAAAPVGVYHGTNSGQTTWFGFTREIFRLAGADPDRVRPTTTEAFPRPAPRPAFSVLGHDRWAAAGLTPMRDWDEALREALPAILATGSSS